MNDLTENNCEKWRDVVELYQSIAAHSDSYQSMLELVRWIDNSEFAQWLVPTRSSHLSLRLAPTGIYRGEPILAAYIYNYGKDFSVEYHQSQTDGGYSILQRSYARDEIRPAIESWLWRLQMEAEIRQTSGQVNA